ncbi:MAG: HEPN domain-containing protein [Candidatus Margulisbacteria bacterium]|jgi:HEPN domain-containing protein|nr:HEPN domain-containing protein [Candidatus Margulisiibacteriota bacterium]
MKKFVEAWILYAEKDIAAAIETNKGQSLTNIVAFHCQQAIEKYFKAYLLEKDKPIIKTHDLILLYGMIKEIKDLKINEDLLALINKTYIEERYPGELGILPDGIPSVQQAGDFLEFARELERSIKKELL